MIAKVNVLGVDVSAVNMDIALDTIETWIAQGDRKYVCVTGVHGLMESHRDPRIKQIHNAAGLVTPDGMPLVWLSRACGFQHVERVYGPDLLLALCQKSMRAGYRHFFYGGGERVAEILAHKLRQRFPGLKIVGTFCPPFRPLTPSEDASMVELINNSNSDIVWVGLSTPKQEVWMAEHLGRIRVPVMIGVGAAFDFHSGVKKQAPLWMQRSGCEWIFRLSQEPRRLWRRYLICNSLFLTFLALQFCLRQRPRAQ